MGILKKILSNDDEVINEENGDVYYDLKPEDALAENDGNTKMVLIEPRAYSEAQQIAEHLKKRNTVLVNLKRVTKDQAKRIIDFLSGAIYAINGDLQQVGGGIFLCTPNNVSIQGKITKENDGKETKEKDEINFEW